MRRAAPVAAALALGSVLGCGQPASLDVEGAEARIASEMATTYELEVADVRCPDEVRAERGASFTCEADLGGTAVAVEVHQVDDDGGLEVEPAGAVLVATRVEADIVEVLADRFSRPGATVDCAGPEVRVEEPGSTFTCSAVDGDEERTVEVRVRDARGALTYSLG